MENSLNARGYDHVLLVKLASTAVISPLLALSRESCLAALSHVMMDAGPLRTYRHKPNTVPRKGWAGGDACMRAVHLALLVRAGQPGARTALTEPRWGFQDAVFGGNPLLLGRDLGNYVMEHIFFKLMPCEGHALAAVEAMLLARQRMDAQGLHVAAVTRIRIRTHAGAVLIISKTGPMRNAADRDHCLQWMMATALLKGMPLEYTDYADKGPWAADPRVDALRDRIDVVEDARFSKDYLDPEIRSMASAVTVFMNDGSVVGDEIVVEYPLGNAKNPRTAEAVREKFTRNLGLMFSASQVQALEEAVYGTVDMPLREFVDLMWKGRRED